MAKKNDKKKTPEPPKVNSPFTPNYNFHEVKKSSVEKTKEKKVPSHRELHNDLPTSKLPLFLRMGIEASGKKAAKRRKKK